MVDSIEAAIEGADVIVIGNGDPEFRRVSQRLGKNQHLVDLVRVQDTVATNGSYDGICW